MNKMKFETPNLTNKNIDKIAELFPNVITETADENGNIKKAVNFDMLRQLLSGDIVEGDEAYEFTWVGKKSAIAEANKPIRKTLRPCPEESVNWDTTENLYIEGDNLEVLKLLQESYLGKVKMIYIDPPYNTGNDFIYCDDFKMSADEYSEEIGEYDEDGDRLFKNTDSNGRFHSDWCSMIYSRLLLARNLLSDDGVILINMDENEITNLQKVCEEVLGESNNVGTIIWDKRNPKGDSKGIAYQHENILVFAKNKNKLVSKNNVQRPKKNAERMITKANQLFKRKSENFTLEEINKEFAEWIKNQDNLSGGERAYNKIDENGEVYRPVSMAWPNKKKAPDDYFIPLIHPITCKPCPVPQKGWRNPSKTMIDLLEQNKILFGKDEKTIPNSKYLLKENMNENIPSLLYYGGSDTDMLAQMNIPFDTPKVVDIVKEHILSFTKQNDIILDFFSGSATTAHAVMQLNADDGGNRKFIMVQIPEKTDEKSEAYKAGYKNICEIGKERIRQAGKAIKIDLNAVAGSHYKFAKEHEEEEKGICTFHHYGVDTGFRVFKIDESNMRDVYYSPAEYDQTMLDDMESNIKPDRTSLDLLFGCLLEWGLPLSMPYSSEEIEGMTVHTYNGGDLVACFDENIPESVITTLAKRKPLRAVFRDSSFADSPAKINVFEIFKLYAPKTRVKVI